MHRSHTAACIAALALLAACGGERPAARDRATADSAAPSSPAAQSEGPSRVEGFQHPESARYDADLDVWYVSNINGDPTAKDGNGFISRLKGDGSLDSLKFIEGGRNGLTLHSPKGMALTGDTLWVADLDAVRAFDRKTGAPLVTIDLKGKAKFLNDVAVGPDGVYITDTGMGSDGKGGMKHVGPDRIFRITGRKASIALETDSLAGPNGIAWDPVAKHFIIGPMGGKNVMAWTPGQKSLTTLAVTNGMIDGIEVLGPGRVLLTSWADSTLFVMQDGKVIPVEGKLPSPADIGVDTKRNRVGIPLLLENRIEFRPLPAATP